MAKMKLTRKQMTLIGAVLGFLILATVGAVAWMLYLSSTQPKNEPKNPVSVEDVQTGALEYVNNNDVDGGLKYYDEQIEKRQDSEEKKQLLLGKSSFASNAQRADVALDAAKQADEISPDIASSEALARAYEASGDKEQALIYYKKVLELSSADGSSGRYNSVWEEKIAELEQ